MKAPRRPFLVFAACVVIVVGALSWTTAVLLRLERAERHARADAAHQETVQRALWRMDSWLSLFLAREAARPHTDYGSAGSDAPSPLLTVDSPYLLLHFELEPGGFVRSPNLPPPAPVDLASFPPLDAEVLRSRRDLLERYRSYLDPDRIGAAIASAEADASGERDVPDGLGEFDARVSCTVPPAPGSGWVGGVPVDVGPLVALWLAHPESGADPVLTFVRMVKVGEEELFQGFIANWPNLRGRLLAEIDGLFPHAALERSLPGAGVADGSALANVPVALVASPAPLPATGFTPARRTLAVAWIVTIVATVGLGITLHKIVELGERRRRFVSAVTHELRTPLTTFRMYSEMLADGVIRDEDKRRRYLETLKDESDRLSGMVENVLNHARIEEGRVRRRKEATTLEDLLERVTPPLRRRAEASGMTLSVEADCAVPRRVDVDVEAIEQVLRNLVDNAGKYGRNGSRPTIHIETRADRGALVFRVRDHGPGVPRESRSSIFTPFERGGRDPSDPIPGVGLGLALARGLARDMGGDVTLEPEDGDGACFRLVVPV